MQTVSQLDAAACIRLLIPPGEALSPDRVLEGHTRLWAETGPSPALRGSSSETRENLMLPVLRELGIGSRDLPLETSSDLLNRGMQKLPAQPELWTRAGLDSWLARPSVQGQAKRTL